MCGIAGFIDYTSRLSSFDLETQVNTLQHRGPDDFGAFFEAHKRYNIGLGNRRLKIIDLSSKGHQPFASACGNYILVFNGTIYNYENLKKELCALGAQFRSHSDTEVLLQSYIYWPETFLDKLNGIFGFAIYDKIRSKVLLSRDPVGVKPLMYFYENGTFIFGSELRVFLKNPCITKKLSFDALSLYLQYSFFPDERTILEKAYKVKPGEKIEIDLSSGKISKSLYWKLDESKTNFDTANVLHQTESLLVDSVKSRIVSDAPVGSLLSGGYDSSLVTAIAQLQSETRLKTFSIGFEEKEYNEAPFAKEIAKHIGTDHYELYFNKTTVKGLVPLFGKTFDEPMGDSGAIGLFLAAKLAQPEVKVLLSGEGGDELFGGYLSYFKALKYAKYTNLFPIPKKLRYNRYFDAFSQPNSFELFDSLKQFIPKPHVDRLLNSDVKINYKPESNDKLNQLLNFDLQHYLPDDLLLKADRCMMHFGIENRDPLLNLKLIEYVASLPGYIKCPNNRPKALMKEIAHKYVPPHLLNRPKRGFSIPAYKWLSEDLRDFTIETITALSSRSLLNSKYVLQTLSLFFQKPQLYRRQVWTLISLELWLQEWFD